jgi:hypothetical protein
LLFDISKRRNDDIKTTEGIFRTSLGISRTILVCLYIFYYSQFILTLFPFPSFSLFQNGERLTHGSSENDGVRVFFVWSEMEDHEGG